MERQLARVHGVLSAVCGQLVLALVCRRGMTRRMIVDMTRELREAADTLEALVQ